MALDEATRARMQEAWEKFRQQASPEELASMETMLGEAHEQANRALQGRDDGDSRTADFAFVQSALGKGEPLPEAVPEFTRVGSDGAIWGFRQYEQLDLGWSEAAIKFFEYYFFKADFASDAQTIDMGANDKIAIAGDWGTGFDYTAKEKYPNPPSKKVAERIPAHTPEWTVHLGDVYYAGTREEIDTKLSKWPAGSKGAFAIPGNHEMYCGDHFYYQILPEHFPLQSGTSYFALRNDDWLFVALDSAYHATAQFYMDGSLGTNNSQTRWLEATLGGAGDRKIVVMTHHQPVSLDGTETNALFGQVSGACQKAGARVSYWYYGHEHNAVVYEDAVLGCGGRLVGHGAIPYGKASELDNSNVVWAETESANDQRYPLRLLNGFMLLELDGPGLTETFYDENGAVRWTSAP